MGARHPQSADGRHAARPPAAVAAATALGAVAAATALGYPLAAVAPVAALGLVYLLAVLLVASLYGGPPGLLAALASVAAFNWFYIPQTGSFTIADEENWVALAVLLVAALVASTVSEQIRSRTQELEQRREEADLAPEMARLLLRGGSLDATLTGVAQRLAHALRLASASIELTTVAEDARRQAFALRDGEHQIATLLAPAGLPAATLAPLAERIVPSLEALLAAALARGARPRGRRDGGAT